jgi:hypothetical protein
LWFIIYMSACPCNTWFLHSAAFFGTYILTSAYCLTLLLIPLLYDCYSTISRLLLLSKNVLSFLFYSPVAPNSRCLAEFSHFHLTLNRHFPVFFISVIIAHSPIHYTQILLSIFFHFWTYEQHTLGILLCQTKGASSSLESCHNPS